MLSASSVVSLRRYAVSALLAITTVPALFAAWPVRDQELVTRITQPAETDFSSDDYNKDLFCAQLPQCFRVANKVVVSTARIATNGLIEAFHFLPGSSITGIPERAKSDRLDPSNLAGTSVNLSKVQIAFFGWFNFRVADWTACFIEPFVGLFSLFVFCSNGLSHQK